MADLWAAAVERITAGDRRTPEELATAVRRGLAYVDAIWPVTAEGIDADLARDALALFLARGGDAAGLLAACDTIPVIRDGSPTVGDRGARAGTRSTPPGWRRWEPPRPRGTAADDDPGPAFTATGPIPGTPDAFTDPAFLDAEYTDDD